MTEAAQLRQEAARALRLSQLIGDVKASEALAAHAADLLEKHAADLLEKADALEGENAPPAPQPAATRQQPSREQQQVQPKKLDDLADC
jgi:hypothetical protein